MIYAFYGQKNAQVNKAYIMRNKEHRSLSPRSLMTDYGIDDKALIGNDDFQPTIDQIWGIDTGGCTHSCRGCDWRLWIYTGWMRAIWYGAPASIVWSTSNHSVEHQQS
jgi:hypothetical protein